MLRAAPRLFSTAPARRVSLHLRKSAVDSLGPGTDGAGRIVGVGDRGAGLVYRAGRLAESSAFDGRTMSAPEGRFVVKVQAPLDESSDSRGGIGRMVPATLLVHNRDGSFVTFVTEEENGHSALLLSLIHI